MMIGGLFAILAVLAVGMFVVAYAGVWGVLLFVLALIVALGGAAS